MFIKTVTDRVRGLYPSEYGIDELYMWCDEVSAMLLVEDRNVYRSVLCAVADDGSILLPEGVSMEYIEYVTFGGREADKKDMRLYGGDRLYVKGMNGFFEANGAAPPRYARVDYLEPYRPIRLTRYRGAAGIDKTNGKFTLPVCEFRAGDTVNMEFSPGKDDAVTLENVPLLAVEYDDGYVCTVPEETFSELDHETDPEVIITRVVTDKTVCDAPFDEMYVDYLIAKIMTYQHDTEGANAHMTYFNSKLAAYKNWLMQRMPSGDCCFRNWW